MTEELRYPIGRVQFVAYTEKAKDDCIQAILNMPTLLDVAVENLNDTHLHTPYREEGWTPNQIIHHLADSHMNAFIRFKLGLTEDKPTIKPYNQNSWATTADVEKVPVNNSITLLHALHRRWYALLITLEEKDFLRTIYHPEQQREISLWNLLQIYAWHGKHHATQIIQLKERAGW